MQISYVLTVGSFLGGFGVFVINNLGRYPDSLNPNLKPSGCTCSWWYTARERGRLKDSRGVDAGEYSAGVRKEIQALRTGQLAPYRQYIHKGIVTRDENFF
jgi:hypothetical protein